MKTSVPLSFYFSIFVSSLFHLCWAPRSQPYFLPPYNFHRQPLAANGDYDSRLTTHLRDRLGYPLSSIVDSSDHPLTDQMIINDIRSSAYRRRFIYLGQGALGTGTMALAMQVQPETISQEGGRKAFALMTLTPPNDDAAHGRHLNNLYVHHFATVDRAAGLEETMELIDRGEKLRWPVPPSEGQVLAGRELFQELARIGRGHRRY